MPAEGNRLAGLIVRRVKREGSVASGLVTLFACGDVMPGGGINQILNCLELGEARPHPA